MVVAGRRSYPAPSPQRRDVTCSGPVSPGNWTHRQHQDSLANAPTFDTVVIGGGVIGCGVALDLQSRGLRVALLEQTDFGAGTSSRSTKLFHGGIRYLPQFRFHLVSEGLREQRVLARVADYLFEPLEFVVPVYDQFGLADAPAWAATGRRASILLGLGLTLYDLLGGIGRPGERNRRLSKSEVLKAAPRLRAEGLRGGFAYSDAQTDDARLVIALARTAVDHGAVAANRVRAWSVAACRSGLRSWHRRGDAADESRGGRHRCVHSPGTETDPAPLIQRRSCHRGQGRNRAW